MIAALVGFFLTVAACVAIVEVTHGWALVVPGFLLVCWLAHRLRLATDRRDAAAVAQAPALVKPLAERAPVTAPPNLRRIK